MKRRALPSRRFNLDASPVPLENRMGDSQIEAAADGFGAEKGFEYMRHRAFGNPPALVGQREAQILSLREVPMGARSEVGIDSRKYDPPPSGMASTALSVKACSTVLS